MFGKYVEAVKRWMNFILLIDAKESIMPLVSVRCRVARIS